MAPKPKDKSKGTPSQTQVPIEDLFTSLNRHIDRSENEQAVKVANQILAIAPGDADAIQCKIVALIKADNIDDALKTLEAWRLPPSDINFLKAYCLYRLNKLEEALELLKNLDKTSDTMTLQSQILYRLGRMDASVEVYQGLSKSKIDSLEINFVASLVSAGQASEVQKAVDGLRVKPTSSFELAHNIACSLIDRNKYKEAEQMLLSARRVGQETLMEEEWADDEIDRELAPISVQLAYVQQLLGHTPEAVESYTDIIKGNLSDELSLAVATNNLIALRGHKEVSDSLKKLDRLMEKVDCGQFRLAQGLDSKLIAKQKEAIYANRALLLLHANRLEQARELVGALQPMFPDSVMPVLLQVAILVRENKTARAEEILLQFAEKSPANSQLFLLTRAQVAASAGHPQVAAESLSKIADIQHMPATVATIVALKERAGDINGADSVFDSAIKWWSNSMLAEASEYLSTIMPEAAAFKLKHGREKEAFHLFEELVKSHKSTSALVGLVTTAAHVDVAKAEVYEKQLEPLPGLNKIDVDKLEEEGTSGAKLVGPRGGGKEVEVQEDVNNKSKDMVKKKRKRKPKYPKGFDPASPGPPPDPERWLPKRERSSFRPKRKDKRAIRGSQGAVAREKQEKSEADTSSKGSSSQAASVSKPSQPSSSTKQGGGGSSKSKKKKSRK